MNNASGTAPGKIILLGEHAVVYGHRAVASAISLKTTVHLCHRPGATALDQPWVDDPRLTEALQAVLPPDGVGVTIQSDLPIGRGMGSSAALAVALGRARAALQGETLTPEVLARDAWAVERIFHGSPSGIDHTVSMSGGSLVFQKTESGTDFSPVQLPYLPLVVIDSGEQGDTARLVAGVRSRRPAVDPILAEIGALVESTIPTLTSPHHADLGRAMSENHRLLQAIGVSTESLDQIVHLALDAGAHGAKLAGAGGGGVVIALADDRGRVAQAAQARGLRAFEIEVGEAPEG